MAPAMARMAGSSSTPRIVSASFDPKEACEQRGMEIRNVLSHPGWLFTLM